MLKWLQENLLFCGMVGSGVFGLWCVAMVNYFYNNVLRDVRQIKDAKSKWTKEFLAEYQNRCKNQQKIKNAEVFVRAQFMNGKVLGVPLQKWKQGIGWGAVLSLFLMLVAVYSNYGQPNSAIVSRQYVLLGAGIFVFLLLTRQVLGFFGKEDMLVDSFLDYMENTNVALEQVVDLDVAREQIREELIQRVTEGIRQTAASQNKFSHMLTSEEEKIVREVIREYLT